MTRSSSKQVPVKQERSLMQGVRYTHYIPWRDIVQSNPLTPMKGVVAFFGGFPCFDPPALCRRVISGLLRRELASEITLENRAKTVLANARRTKEMLDEPRKELLSRVDSLAQKSFSENLRGALKDRHVSVARLRAASVVEMAVSERSASRRVFTAPAAGSGSSRHTSRVGISAHGNAEGRGRIASLGRGGVCTSADGWTQERGIGGTTARASRTAAIPVGRRTTTGEGHPRSSSSPTTDRKHRSLISGGRTPLASILSPERSTERSVERSADHTESPSLQASASSMSDRARARARAQRSTATRRGRKGGKLIVVDPATSNKTREKSALWIQAAFFGARARSTARRLRERREWAAITIGRVWRGWRVRVVMWTMNWVERAERLKQRVEDRVRLRSAHLVTIFFRDIVYRKRRVRERGRAGIV